MEQKYFEVPLCIAEGTTTTSGIIDAVFKEQDGWVIIDYKTDDFNQDRKKTYNEQLTKYTEYWQKIKEKLLLKV